MIAVTAKQMQRIDRTAIQELNIPGIDLMEEAGRGLLSKSIEFLGEKSGLKTLIFCGKGNNGGDGYVLARLLKERGYQSACFLAVPEKSITGDALTNLKRLEALKTPVTTIGTIEELPSLKDCGLIVDALFGTGFSGTPRGIYAEMIKHINTFQGPVLSVDVPSGMDIDNNSVSDTCVKASATVTMGFPKTGFYFYPCKSFVGELTVHPLPFPESAVKKENISTEITDRDFVKNIIPKRQPDGHKGAFGRVLVVAGSGDMAGAAMLTSESVLRSGAGMVVTAVPASIQSVFIARLPEAMTIACPETETRTFSIKSIEKVMEKIHNWADVLVIGPGLGQHAETAELARELVKNAPVPAVVDADALNAFSDCTNELSGIKTPRVITPHKGEFSRLWKTDNALTGISLTEHLKELSKHKFGNTILYKGAPTLVVSPSGRCRINTSGNSGMATAGSGDVLSGIIGGLIARGMNVPDASSAGAYIHGLAGDFAAEELGESSLIAEDILKFLPAALKTVE